MTSKPPGDAMASLLIRKVDPALHARLKARAADHRRTLEEEARELLRAAMARSEDETGQSLLDAAERWFGKKNGVDLELPPREPERPPPDFSGPEYKS